MPQEPSTLADSVLFVDHTAQLGGAELVIPKILGLSRLPIRVILLEDGPLIALLEQAGHLAIVANPRPALGLFSQAWGLRSALRQRNLEIVVSNTLRASLLVAVLKPRRLIHVAMLHDGLDAQSISASKRWMAVRALNTAKAIVANSNWSKATLAKPSLRSKSVVVYPPSGVRLSEAAKGRRLAAESGPLRVVFVGRLVKWKGPDLLLRALAELEPQLRRSEIEVNFVGSAIMGHPDYANKLVSQAARLPFDIKFAGQVSDVHANLIAADVLVHCSVRPEPFGTVIVQALGAGLCVIAPDSGGPLEILDPGDSRAFYRMGDVSDLAKKLLELVRDRSIVNAIAKSQAALLPTFADDVLVEAFDRIIAKALVMPGRTLQVHE